MTAGYSGSYGVNGVNLTLQPTVGKWIARNQFGFDGGGHPVYSAVREFEMTFALSDPSEYDQILGFYESVKTTGTSVVDLPQYGASAYLFFSYSGCLIHEPEPSEYFNEAITSTRWTIGGIRT